MSFFSLSQTSSSSLKPLKTLAMVLCGLAIVFSGTAFAQTGLPLVNVSSDPNGATEYSLTLQVLILMTVLTLLPSILIMMTSFVRIIIVMSLLRQAIGTAQTPPNTVLVGIALFLTFFIMAPVFETLYEDAFVPYVAEEISAEAALMRRLFPCAALCLLKRARQTLWCFRILPILTIRTSQKFL